ncbi:CAP domain-containing protein, partial [Psychromonas sp.]|nr:CAP domain-containing protein [Psychromonas sp.]
GSLCLILIAGCNSSSPSNDTNSSTTEEDNTSNGNDGNDVNVIDYTQIRCEDDLTEVLTLINELRAQPQTCGSTLYSAVDALAWSNLLTLAAEKHSNDMANANFFSHTGSDDSSAGDRITEQGYSWSSYAENIAAGQTSVQSVVDGWMNSEGHCKNIMSENITEMGLACTTNDSADYKTYWTQDFARPRS